MGRIEDKKIINCDLFYMYLLQKIDFLSLDSFFSRLYICLIIYDNVAKYSYIYLHSFY
jgi:hypothetical protein